MPQPGRSVRVVSVPVSVLLLLLLLLLLDTAAAEEVELVATAFDGSDRYWFEFDGIDGEDPTLTFAAGDAVTVTLRNAGTQPHTLHFGPPIGAQSAFVSPGDDTTFHFVVPSPHEGVSDYWCDPHRDLGMGGDAVIGTPESVGPEATPRGTPGPGLLFPVALMVALWGGHRARRAHLDDPTFR